MKNILSTKRDYLDMDGIYRMFARWETVEQVDDVLLLRGHRYEFRILFTRVKAVYLRVYKQVSEIESIF